MIPSQSELQQKLVKWKKRHPYANVAEIADAVHMNRSTLYGYFRGKGKDVHRMKSLLDYCEGLEQKNKEAPGLVAKIRNTLKI